MGNAFRYNTAVFNVNRTVVHNTYIDRTVIVNNTTVNHTSFNGPGGVDAKPRPEELAAMKEQHVPPTAEQMQHEQHAHQDKSQFASVNHGKPAKVAMNKVGGAHFTAQGKRANPNQQQQHMQKQQQKQQQRMQNQQQKQQQHMQRQQQKQEPKPEDKK